jgi:two-component system response regulator RegX3
MLQWTLGRKSLHAWFSSQKPLTQVCRGGRVRSTLSMDSKLLLVTDSVETGGIWSHALGQRRAEVVLAASVEEALAQWEKDVFDLIMVDVHTSQLDGIDTCHRLRAEAVIPIVLLLPEATEAKALDAYQAGVDECIVKPIGPALLVAKVMAWLARSWTVPARSLDIVQAGELRLDPARRELVTADGTVVKLTNLEFRLLHLLMTHPGQVLEAGLILDRVWGYPDAGDTIVLKNLVYRLRQKMEPEPGDPQYIQTVSGEGYTFHAT